MSGYLNSHYRTKAESPKETSALYHEITTHINKADQLNQKELGALNSPLFLRMQEVEDDFRVTFPLPKTIEPKGASKSCLSKNDSLGSSEYFNGKASQGHQNFLRRMYCTNCRDFRNKNFPAAQERLENKKLHY